MGAIADRARSFISVTWHGLTGDARFGITLLQGRVERAKYEVLGSAAPAEPAEGTLPEDQIEHIAKRAVVKIIPAGIEFWADQPIAVNTTGTAEVVSYESRIDTLRKLFAQLTQEIAEEEPLVTPILSAATGFPAVSDGQSDILITPNPHTFPPLYNTGEEV